MVIPPIVVGHDPYFIGVAMCYYQHTILRILQVTIIHLATTTIYHEVYTCIGVVVNFFNKGFHLVDAIATPRAYAPVVILKIALVIVDRLFVEYGVHIFSIDHCYIPPNC
jgi:hypothetical protein